jgi:hypothetical protein
MCTKIFVRGYAESKKRRSRKWQPRESTRPASWFDERFCVIDTETVDHELKFGAFAFYDRKKLVKRAVFYRDDLPTRDSASFEELRRICRARQLPLYSLGYVFTSYIWKWRRIGGTFTFFNASYDLSRLATHWKPATEGMRRGSSFVNGFAFTRTFDTAKDGDGKPMLDADGELLHRTVERTFVRIRRDDRHHSRYDMAAAHVLDLATLAFALTDEMHSLQSACEAFGIEFVDRPGAHSGEVTEENVDGCLYDVEKTSELLFTLGREYDRHPIDLPPWRAQSGASLAKSYLRAFGVVPRSIVQPDDPLKEYQGYAATAYFGGRVEARIVNEPVACAYVDAVSMYPTAFTLLNLWFNQVIPERLEPEEIAPAEVQALLDDVHANPNLLLDPAMWPRFAFFAQVDPNSATLPSRPEIPAPHPSRRTLIAEEAQGIYEERSIVQHPYWSALDECGGRIIPDMIFDPESKRWKMAGEFSDLPHGLIRANPRRPATGRADGNIDRITQHVRDALGDPDITTSDVLEFFRTHDRPSKREARKAAREEVPETEDAASHRLVSIGPIESKVPLWFAGPDLAAAAISGSGRPRVLRAWRLRPEGVQGTLRPVSFRGEDEIDPRTTNPFHRLIELRKRKSSSDLDDRLRSTGYKVIANSGAYGIFVETTPEDIDPDAPRELRPVRVWGLSEFSSSVDRPERHSPLCFFPIASLVTAGARLLLAVAEYLVHDAGGEVAYCDTDSLMIVANEHGGLVPCAGGQYRAKDGSRAVRALSRTGVDRILVTLATLNLYPAVSESSFQLEDENSDDNGQRRDLRFFGTREKSYALYASDSKGEPVIVKHSAHTIGQYSSPIPGDKMQQWIADAWAFTIRKALGLPVEDPVWFRLPTLSQLTLTTLNLMKHYAKTCNPFDFLAVAQIAYPGLLRCCDAPRPSCQLFPNIEQWADQRWQCLKCGAPVDPFMADTEQSIFKRYERVVSDLAASTELKRLLSNGEEPTRENVRGLTIPRPVRIESISDIEHIGKEVIVDPSETEEGITAELLGETQVLMYEDHSRRLETLRTRIRGLGVTRVARASGVSRSQIKAFVNQGTLPRGATARKLEAAIKAARG